MTFAFDAPDPESVPVRDAATVMLLRDGEAGIEVQMLRRNLQSDFVGGAYVFPGGAVDPDDTGREVEEVAEGRDDRTASNLLGIESGGLAIDCSGEVGESCFFEMKGELHEEVRIGQRLSHRG